MYAPPRPRAITQIRLIATEGFSAVASTLGAGFDSNKIVRLVGIAPDGVDAVKLAYKLKPDVLMIDLHAPMLDAVRATRCIVNARIPSKILVFTTEDDLVLAKLALDAGADGLLVRGKTQIPDVLAAIRVAAAQPERIYIEPWERAV